MIVDDRPGESGHPLITVRIDGDIPNEEGNRMMVTDLALTYLKHLRPLKIAADDVWMLGAILNSTSSPPNCTGWLTTWN